jgi:hypothetical protein
MIDLEYVRKMGDYDAEELAALELPRPAAKRPDPPRGEPWFTMPDPDGDGLARAA